MLVSIWSHMLVTSYLGSLIGPDDGPRPFCEVWPKTHDGLYVASTWDRWANPQTGVREPHPLAIDGPEKLTQIAKMHAAAGRNVRPWCVVKGLDPEEEGRLGARMAVAAAAGNLTHDRVLIIDLEPYYHGGEGNPQFWRSDLFTDGPDRVRRFLEAYAAEAGPGSTVWVAGDVRQAHLAAVSYETWARHPVVSLHTPQTYYTIFDGDPNTSLDRAKMHIDRANAILAGFGVEPGRIGHILPAEGDPTVLVGAFGYCHELRQQKPSIWQRVNITDEACSVLAAAADPWAEGATTTPPPSSEGAPPANQGVGRETRLIPVGPAVLQASGDPVVEYTDADDERLITVPVSGTVRMRTRIVRD